MAGLAGYGVFFATWITLAILAPTVLDRWYSIWGMLPIGTGTAFVLANSVFPYVVAFVIGQAMIKRGKIMIECKKPGVAHLLAASAPLLLFTLMLSIACVLA